MIADIEKSDIPACFVDLPGDTELSGTVAQRADIDDRYDRGVDLLVSGVTHVRSLLSSHRLLFSGET